MTRVTVVGGGPAGLMAADVISSAGIHVTVFERMPSVGRKLLMAGRGGLNLTHNEELEAFLGRYGAARAFMQNVVGAFPPAALCEMAAGLGQETFVGSSGRIFPRAMKASPLLRAWLVRLAQQGVEIRTRHRLTGFDESGAACIAAGDSPPEAVAADAIVLALGGGSWPRLGSDGTWVPWLDGLGISVKSLAPSNVGVTIGWGAHFRDRFAGAPLKRIALAVDDVRMRGEAIVTRDGLEGGAVYAMTPAIRAALARRGSASLAIDLRPDLSHADLMARLSRPRGKQSVSEWLRKTVHLAPVAIGLLREATANALPGDAESLARAIKAVTLSVVGMGALERAISTAGGVALDEIDLGMMIKARPGLFVAGEMLDWEAPTGGYLLQGCFATGYAAGNGVLRYLGRVPSNPELDVVSRGPSETRV
ncbi:MAG: TIGR03862 family flavoprotein [Hyphomicrobiaceae bacterium]